METFFEKVAEIITASSTKLGLVALMVIVVAVLAYFFFKQESAQTKKKIFAGIVGLLFVLALVVLLLPESTPPDPEREPEPEVSTSTGSTDPSASPETPPEDEPTTPEDEPATPEDEPTTPQAPAPVEAWIHGADLRRALELVGATYQVVEDEDDCSIQIRDNWIMAEVKARITGNRCGYKFHEGMRLDNRCRVLEWDFELSDASEHRWIVQPESGRELLVHFRMWADVPGRKVRLFLKRVRLRVPGTAAVNSGELNAAAFHAACLAPAG